jgi:rRNA maturation protein Nop10
VVYVEVAQMLINKIEKLEDTYTLEKCPVKDSKVTISIEY